MKPNFVTIVSAALLGALLLAPLGSAAQDTFDPVPDKQLDEAVRAAEEAARNLINILRLLVRAIPQYEAPVVLDNGDILIRRIHRDAPNGEPDNDTAPDATTTLDESRI